MAVLEEWFSDCVAKYDGATATSDHLYDGMGHSLMAFANRRAGNGVHISKNDMESFLDKKGVRSRNAMFNKRYDGVQIIIHGNVRSGNYGT